MNEVLLYRGQDKIFFIDLWRVSGVQEHLGYRGMLVV